MSDSDSRDKARESIRAYEKRVEAIRAYNQPLLDDFRVWLEQSGLSEKTVRSHIFNIGFFTEYLVYYDDPLKRLDEACGGDIWSFLAHWYPRKALWASANGVKRYIASFKKFFQWMQETGRVSPETVAEVLKTLKDGRDDFLAAVDKY